MPKKIQVDYVNRFTSTHPSMYIYIFVCIYVYTFIYISVYIYIYINKYIYLYDVGNFNEIKI